MTARPPPASYQEYYADAANDPYSGTYQALMEMFRTSNNPPGGAVLRSQVGNADAAYPMAFLCLCEHPVDECGRLTLLQGVSKFPSTLGRPTSWDGGLFAFVGGVVDGQASTSVHFPADAFDFDRADGTNQNIPATTARTLELLEQNPNDELLGPFPDTEANIRQVRMRNLVPVPHRYVPLLLNRELTPREGYKTLATTLVDDNATGDCHTLLDLISLALTRNSATTAPSVMRSGLTAPVSDANLIRHRQEVLQRHLPDRGSSTVPPAGNADLVRSVEQVAAEQRMARNEARDRAAASQLPKSPRSYFGDDAANSLLALCQVGSDDALPHVWHRLATAGKKDRLALEQAVLAKARTLGMAEQTPIITPDLTKKVTGLLWAGNSLDDLGEGIQPFSLTLPDYATSDRGTKAQQQAETYDLLTSTSSTTTLRDAQSLKSSKVVLPTDYLDARADMTATMLIWSVLVGDTHPFVTALGRLVQQYTSREHFYRNRLEGLGAKGPPPALLLRFVQLRICNYWREALAYRTVPTQAPDFTEILAKLTDPGSHSCQAGTPRRIAGPA